MPDETRPSQPADDGTTAVQGEGDYVAARRFQQRQHAFAADQERVDEAAHAAEEALDGPESEELERARLATARGEPLSGR